MSMSIMNLPSYQIFSCRIFSSLTAGFDSQFEMAGPC